MNTIDVIILSNTADSDYHNLLSITINSIKSQSDVLTNVILVETNNEYKTKEQYNLPIDVLVIPNEPFHFNKFLNYGLSHSTAEYICFSNNDVRYHPNSLSELISALQTYDSVSPYAPQGAPIGLNHKGYSTGLDPTKVTEGDEINKYFFGFCFCFTRKTMKNCFLGGKFDERFAFWFQDDDIIYTLRKKKAKHALVGPARVDHLNFKGQLGIGGNSYKLFLKHKLNTFLMGQKPKLNKKWKID